MRINFENKDYIYNILTKAISKDTIEIKVSLLGEEFTLVRTLDKEWDVFDKTIMDNPGLLRAIGKNIALRYRL
ncbi:hypothetical protein [Pedobacter miscanthi]|uniref:Uncharacterized protein n=1 Tax=Pedobacter miscanthi TaxID=2259170 RepID=A0A366L1S8_9SPHI|nr:hypothetical protein [Pedobacter miscanthi]RBQ07827.1 hypothetical protein DRW42_09490 [Pedobacter miscanthi]